MSYVKDRLDDAAVALSRGAPALAAPELRAALRLLQRGRGDAEGLAAIRTGTESLLRLVEAA